MKTITKSFLIAAALFLMAGNVARAQLYLKLDASFYSQALDAVKMVDIYLPKDYYEHPERQYASIYYLHGAGGNQNEGQSIINHYYTTHHINPISDSLPPAIFISPDGSCGPYLGSYWLNSILYGNYEDYVISDLISFIESEFRVMPDKNFRFITGYSMGGHGSAYLALKHPDIFRACAPLSAAHIAYPDTLMEAWINILYEDNGGYNFNYNASQTTKLTFTVSGGFAPNMELEPNFFEMLWDTLGNRVDTVWTKWLAHDCSKLVAGIPDDENLDFYLICGTEDQYGCYPPYLSFQDSLNKYGIEFKSMYNAYNHGPTDPVANALMWRWMDSLAMISFQSVGIIESCLNTQGKISLFPNPVNDFATLSFEGEKAGVANVILYNSTGISVKTWKFNIRNSGQSNFMMDFRSLPVGMYLCKVQIEDRVVAKKIIKQ
jgi:S-formylglutathione hydrolase FrmB